MSQTLRNINFALTSDVVARTISNPTDLTKASSAGGLAARAGNAPISSESDAASITSERPGGPTSPGTAPATPAIPNDSYIRLGQAASLVPGRPSTNCVWRWCRHGVLARNGERVRLQHVRLGGKIFTTPTWVAEFGQVLARTDADHFDARDAAARALPPRDPAYGPPTRRRMPRTPTAADVAARRAKLDEVNRELDAEGL